MTPFERVPEWILKMLPKFAVSFDEKSKSPEHPTKKEFDGKKTVMEKGNTAADFATKEEFDKREVGNPTVESKWPKAPKSETDKMLDEDKKESAAPPKAKNTMGETTAVSAPSKYGEPLILESVKDPPSSHMSGHVYLVNETDKTERGASGHEHSYKFIPEKAAAYGNFVIVKKEGQCALIQYPKGIHANGIVHALDLSEDEAQVLYLEATKSFEEEWVKKVAAHTNIPVEAVETLRKEVPEDYLNMVLDLNKKAEPFLHVKKEYPEEWGHTVVEPECSHGCGKMIPGKGGQEWYCPGCGVELPRGSTRDEEEEKMLYWDTLPDGSERLKTSSLRKKAETSPLEQALFKAVQNLKKTHPEAAQALENDLNHLLQSAAPANPIPPSDAPGHLETFPEVTHASLKKAYIPPPEDGPLERAMKALIDEMKGSDPERAQALEKAMEKPEPPPPPPVMPAAPSAPKIPGQKKEVTPAPKFEVTTFPGDVRTNLRKALQKKAQSWEEVVSEMAGLAAHEGGPAEQAKLKDALLRAQNPMEFIAALRQYGVEGMEALVEDVWKEKEPATPSIDGVPEPAAKAVFQALNGSKDAFIKQIVAQELFGIKTEKDAMRLYLKMSLKK